MNAPPRQDKFRAYRERKKAAGLREVRIWVPDIDSPDFKQRLADQIARINGSADEEALLAALDDSAAEMWAKLD